MMNKHTYRIPYPKWLATHSCISTMPAACCYSIFFFFHLETRGLRQTSCSFIMTRLRTQLIHRLLWCCYLFILFCSLAFLAFTFNNFGLGETDKIYNILTELTQHEKHWRGTSYFVSLDGEPLVKFLLPHLIWAGGQKQQDINILHSTFYQGVLLEFSHPEIDIKGLAFSLVVKPASTLVETRRKNIGNWHTFCSLMKLCYFFLNIFLAFVIYHAYEPRRTAGRAMFCRIFYGSPVHVEHGGLS